MVSCADEENKVNLQLQLVPWWLELSSLRGEILFSCSIFIQKIHMTGTKWGVICQGSIELRWIVMLGNLVGMEEWLMMWTILHLLKEFRVCLKITSTIALILSKYCHLLTHAWFIMKSTKVLKKLMTPT